MAPTKVQRHARGNDVHSCGIGVVAELLGFHIIGDTFTEGFEKWCHVRGTV